MRIRLLIALLLLLVAAWVIHRRTGIGRQLELKLTGKKTVEQRLAEVGIAAKERLHPFFQEKGVSYPPSDVVLFYSKQDRTLRLLAKSGSTPFKEIKSYKVKAASGDYGPKLREGDWQVPEGIYRIEYLHPNSAYHLALRLNYPNDDDRNFAQKDGRSKLGGDIMIHGKAVSVGCLAMGDEAIEELFTLAAQSSWRKWRVILAPANPRQTPLEKFIETSSPTWLRPHYKNLSKAILEVL